MAGSPHQEDLLRSFPIQKIFNVFPSEIAGLTQRDRRPLLIGRSDLRKHMSTTCESCSCQFRSPLRSCGAFAADIDARKGGSGRVVRSRGSWTRLGTLKFSAEKSVGRDVRRKVKYTFLKAPVATGVVFGSLLKQQRAKQCGSRFLADLFEDGSLSCSC